MNNQSLIELYLELKEYVDSYGTGGMERDERLMFNKGKSLYVEQKEQERKASLSRVRYTREEITQLVNLYLQNDNLHFVRDTFIKNNPEQLHTVDSVYQTVAQLRTLDINYPDDTRWAVKSLVEEVATSIAPQRFGSKEEMKALSLQLKAEAIMAELIG